MAGEVKAGAGSYWSHHTQQGTGDERMLARSLLLTSFPLLALVSVNCHLDTAWRHLRRESQLRVCPDQIGLPVYLERIALTAN